MSEKKNTGTNLLGTFIKNQSKEKNAYLEVKPGAIVRIHQRFVDVLVQSKSKKQAKTKEAEKIKERIQIFEGIVIARHGKSALSTITIRKISDGVGVEYILPLDLPSIKKIEVVKQGKARRAKLYYLRDKAGKAIHLKDAVQEEVKKKKALAAIAKKKTESAKVKEVKEAEIAEKKA